MNGAVSKYARILQAGYVFGTAIAADDPREQGQAIVQVLNGSIDDDLRLFIAHKRHWEEQSLTEEQQKTIELDLTRLKGLCRRVLQNTLDEAERADLRRQQADLKALQERLRKSNTPHPEGTVAELAKRLGLYKSEIRRRKADGTLNDLLKEA